METKCRVVVIEFVQQLHSQDNKAGRSNYYLTTHIVTHDIVIIIYRNHHRIATVILVSHVIWALKLP